MDHPSPSHWVTKTQFQAAMRRRHLINGAVALVGAILFLLALVLPAIGSQTAGQSRSTAGPAPTTEPADEIMDRLLRGRDATTSPATSPSTSPSTTRQAPDAVPLDPGRFAGAVDRTSGDGDQVVAPDTPETRLAREGSYVVDRVGRVLPSRDGSGLEFVFDADGQTAAAAVDPPMLLVPNLNLMAVERALEASQDRRFRVTGRVTEYRGRNYLMLEKVIFLR